MRTEKLGFWSLTSLVAGSQIGTGIFLLPATLVLYGFWGIGSWFIAGAGALLLAFVFGSLAADRPKTGGPHTFIEAAFGETFGFFSAWLYWIISWFSSSLVVVSIITYLTPLIGDLNPLINLAAKVSVLALVTWLNIMGVKSAGRTEFILTLLKLVPLVIVPFFGLWYINFDTLQSIIEASKGGVKVISEATLLTFWGFIGVESATTPAESVINPKKNIPRALITGTLLVAFVYTFSSTIVMGVVPVEQLAQSKAPFAAAGQMIFGGNWHLLISIAASLVCLGTLNAWVLTSGQIALGAAQDGHLPRLFMKTNRHGVSVWGLTASSLGIIPVLVLSMHQNIASIIHFTIDISVTAFLLIYTLSVLSYIKLFWQRDIQTKCIGVSALVFCFFILFTAGPVAVTLALLMALTGLPFFIVKKRKASFAYFSKRADNHETSIRSHD